MNATFTKPQLHVWFDEKDIPDLQRLLNRALNTLEPAQQPPWALDLSNLVDAYLQERKAQGGVSAS